MKFFQKFTSKIDKIRLLKVKVTLFEVALATFWNIRKMCKIESYQQDLSTIFLKLLNIYLFSKIFQKVKILMLRWNILQYLKKMLREYFSCNERLEIFLTYFCNNLCCRNKAIFYRQNRDFLLQVPPFCQFLLFLRKQVQSVRIVSNCRWYHVFHYLTPLTPKLLEPLHILHIYLSIISYQKNISPFHIKNITQKVSARFNNSLHEKFPNTSLIFS